MSVKMSPNNSSEFNLNRWLDMCEDILSEIYPEYKSGSLTNFIYIVIDKCQSEYVVINRIWNLFGGHLYNKTSYLDGSTLLAIIIANEKGVINLEKLNTASTLNSENFISELGLDPKYPWISWRNEEVINPVYLYENEMISREIAISHIEYVVSKEFY